MKTLLIDGDNLFKIGFHGVRDLFVEGEHIGGVFHFINAMRKQVDEHNYDKVIVFWDGEQNSSERRKIYPEYKLNRRNDMNEYKFDSYIQQKERVKQYIEECFVRQIRIENCEADDLIGYYCLISTDEEKVIFSADKDYTQLIDKNTSIYSPIAKKYYRFGDKIKFQDFEFPHYNVKTLKIMTGDKSDNIYGIHMLGEKTLIKFFPEMLDSEVSYSDILTKAEKLLKEENNKTLNNIISGKTKQGEFGKEFYEKNQKLVDLKAPIISDEGKSIVRQYYSDTIDPEGRGYKNLIRMMTQDGFFKYLGKSDSAFLDFVRPFMKLTRKEKRQYKNQNN